MKGWDFKKRQNLPSPPEKFENVTLVSSAFCSSRMAIFSENGNDFVGRLLHEGGCTGRRLAGREDDDVDDFCHELEISRFQLDFDAKALVTRVSRDSRALEVAPVRLDSSSKLPMAAPAESVPAPDESVPAPEELREDLDCPARGDSAAERQSGVDMDAGESASANGDANPEKEKGKEEAPLSKQQAVTLYALRSQQTCGEDQVR